MAFPPRHFIIGAQKAGTTTLAYVLAQHPDVVLSHPKEPNFFHFNWDKGFEWYRSRFSREDGLLLDASVAYTMIPFDPATGEVPDDVPSRIKQVSPDAKFIYVVRDPAERCYSAYWHEIRLGTEKRPLRAAVQERAYYTMGSYYDRQFRAFLRFFPRDRFLILRFEDAMHRLIPTAKICGQFFGLSDDFEFKDIPALNQGFTYNSLGKVIRASLGERRLKPISQLARRILPQSAQDHLRSVVTQAAPKAKPADLAWLTGVFEEDAEAFERLAGMSVWNEQRRVAPQAQVSVS